MLGGIVNVTSSSVSNNVAGEYGSAFDVTTQGPLSSEKTIMYIDMSDVSNNVADRGAAMFLYALDLLKVSRTTFRNNSGTLGSNVEKSTMLSIAHEKYFTLCSFKRWSDLV